MSQENALKYCMSGTDITAVKGLLCVDVRENYLEYFLYPVNFSCTVHIHFISSPFLWLCKTFFFTVPLNFLHIQNCNEVKQEKLLKIDYFVMTNSRC